MKLLLALAALCLGLLSTPSYAINKTIKRGELVVVFTDKKCTSEAVLALADMIGLAAEHKKNLKQGSVAEGNLSATMCYVEIPKTEDVFVIDELGNMGEFNVGKD
jgi:hypothetical protein